MTPQQADKLKINWRIVLKNKLVLVERYIDFRCWKQARVWYPINGGYVCFGIDADAYKGGKHFKYWGINACAVDEVPQGEFKIGLQEWTITNEPIENQNKEINLITLITILKR